MQIGDHFFEDSPEAETSASSADGESADQDATPGLLSAAGESATHAAEGESLSFLRADFSAFCEESTGALLRTAWRITCNKYDAEDAVQNVLEKFWTRWPNPRFRDAVKSQPGYSHTCVTRAAIDCIRSEKSRSQRQEKVAGKVVVSESDYSRVDDGDSFKWGLELLKQLNPTWHLVIYLRYAQEKTIAEVAANLRIGETTARRYEKRALKALKEAYKGN
jgi:RNA polymerase sigma factor (sigma-70 family)